MSTMTLWSRWLAMAVLLAGSVAPAQQLQGPQWSYIEIVDSTLLWPIYPHIAVDEDGGLHLVVLDDPESDNFSQDVLYYLRPEGDGWHRQMLFRDPVRRITSIGFGFDDQGLLHLVVGITNDTLGVTDRFENLYHMTCQQGTWTEMRKIYGPGKCQDLDFCTLPNGRVAIAWTDRVPSRTTLWKLWGKGRWGPTQAALTYFSPKGSGVSNFGRLASGPGDTLHLAFFGEPRGSIWYPCIYYTCTKLGGQWSPPSEVYFNPKVEYDWPVFAVTRDGCRHLFWVVDYDRNIFPDQIIYSSSRDGRSWSVPARLSHHALTNLPFHYPCLLRVVGDSSGMLHTMWHYVAWPKEVVYWYRCGRESDWSPPVPVFPDGGDLTSFDLFVDAHNRLHFVWITTQERDWGITSPLWHAVAQLPTSPVRAEPLERGPQTPFISAQAWPNPCNDRLAIQLVLSQPCLVTVQLYDLAGRCVRVLAEKRPSAESRALLWDGCDEQGVPLPSGVYLYRVVAEQGDKDRQPQVVTGKVSLVR